MPLTFIIKSGDFNFEISSYISRLHSFFKFFDYDKDSKDELFINYLVPASLASSALVSQSKSWTDTDMENCWRQAQKTMWDHQNTELGEQPIKIEPDFELLGYIRPANRSKKTVCSTSVPTLN